MTEAMTAHRSLAVALVTACLLVASCASSREASVAAKVDPLFATWTRPDSPGCGVGVSRNGAVIFERGYGLANLERRVPITSSTVFHLASITKSFTAMSVLLAAERGVLSLDDEVSKYVLTGPLARTRSVFVTSSLTRVGSAMPTCYKAGRRTTAIPTMHS